MVPALLRVLPAILRLDRPRLVHHHGHILWLRLLPPSMECYNLLPKLHHANPRSDSLHRLEAYQEDEDEERLRN